MKPDRFYYILKLQYLGFRYHGWQKQPNVITVEHMVYRTIKFVLQRSNFKVLAASRTDAKVSVNEGLVELFVDEEKLNLNTFLDQFNLNLPADIRCLSIVETNAQFNIIQHPKIKEYWYVFSYGEKFHPFAASLMSYYRDTLNIEEMKQAAQLFMGTHNFWSYTYKPTENTNTVATIQHAEIVENTELTASFFPASSFIFKVSGMGFKRHMVRLMMGSLLDLGAGKITMDQFKLRLDGSNQLHIAHVAPSSGLMLYRTDLKSQT